MHISLCHLWRNPSLYAAVAPAAAAAAAEMIPHPFFSSKKDEGKEKVVRIFLGRFLSLFLLSFFLLGCYEKRGRREGFLWFFPPPGPAGGAGNSFPNNIPWKAGKEFMGGARQIRFLVLRGENEVRPCAPTSRLPPDTRMNRESSG